MNSGFCLSGYFSKYSSCLELQKFCNFVGQGMKTAKLKAVIGNLSERELRLIIINLYKAIPKRLKDEKSIDSLITHPESFITHRRRKEKEIPDIEELQDETKQFITYAYNQYYFAPNQFVHKRERPKWRFIARRLYKSLISAASVEENLPVAARLLEKLYIMLCYSCRYVLFSAYDSFNSVGISQADFFEGVLNLKYKAEKPEEFVESAIRLMINNGLNRYTLYEDLMDVVLKMLKTPDLKNIAIEKCNQIRRKLQSKPHKISAYQYNKMLANLAIMGFLCYVRLYEYQEGIDYFKKEHKEKDEEIKLYILLRLLKRRELSKYWKQEYELAVKNGIRPRKELQEEYKSKP